MKSFSPTQTLQAGWDSFKRAWKTYYLIALIGFGALFAVNMLVGILTDGAEGAGSLLSFVVGNYLNSGIAIGLVLGFLSIVRRKSFAVVQIVDPLKNWRLVLNFFIAQLLFGLLVSLGFVLLVVPGVYWMIKYTFTLTLIADQGLSIGEAFRRSAAMTQGVKLRILGLMLLTLLLNFVGLLAAGVGLLITIPVSTLAGSHLYVKLSAKSKTRK